MRMRFVVAAAVSLLSVGLFAVTLGSAARQGVLFVDYQAAGPCASRITGVSNAVKAQGLRPGDVVELGRMNSTSRLRLFFPPRAGENTVWPIQRGGQHLNLTLTFGSQSSFQPLGILIRLSFVLIGLLALWRGRDKASLGLGVFFCGISAILAPSYAILNTNATLFAIGAIAVLGAASLVGLVSMAVAMTSAFLPKAWVTFARIATPIIALMHLAAFLASQLQPIFAGCDSQWATQVQIGAFSAQMAITMSLLGAALHRAPAAERARVRWIYWSTSIGFVGPFYGVVLVLLHRPSPTFDWYNLTILAIPFGYAYAILRHRLIDVGFVLNRALVYGILTTFIVGVLAVAESLVAYAALGSGASLTVELAVAVVLGLSFNALHKKIDVIVDQVFFRRKHEAEEMLHRLAHESAFIEKPAVLLDRAVDELFRYTEATGCWIYERDGDRYRLVRARGDAPAHKAIDVDDPAFVRMRATLREVDLEDVRSALGTHGLAIPMAVRGALIGAVVLGRRKNDEPYAPDERSSLLHVAREIALALHAMQAKEHAELVRALATGLIDVRAAESRAKQLRALT